MTHPLDRETIRIGTLIKGAEEPARMIEALLPLGFESFSLTWWQTLEGTDLKKTAADVRAVLAGTGVTISSLAIFGNPLEAEAKDKQTRAGWGELIDATADFECSVVAGFTGRLRGKPIPESIPAFGEVFGPLAARAAERGVRLAFENCSMGGTWKAGDWNIAHGPDAWALMFEAVPAENVGLEWEPCHQMVRLIDPLPQLKAWVHKVFHVHGKDATIHHDVLRTTGINASVPFAEHRTPGFGDSNWSDIITELRRAGFVGSIDIEGWHDPVYKGELEMTGQVHGLYYLQRCRGGSFVPNP